jgi:hypothetical protein
MRRSTKIGRPDRRRNRYPLLSIEGFFNTIRPVRHSDGCDPFRLGDELSPCVAGGVYDGVIVLEDGVREPALAEILPDVLYWIQLGCSRRQENRCDVFRHDELARRMPSGAIEQ